MPPYRLLQINPVIPLGVLLGCVLAFYLLFLVQPDLPPHRSLLELWNFAHLLFFAALTFTTLTLLRHRLQQTTFWKIIIAVLLVTLVLGGTTEFIQARVGREASLQDWILDIAGGGLGCILYFLATRKNKRHYAVTRDEKFWLGLLGLGIVSSCMPLFIAIADDLTARFQFPVLANFNSPLEVTRFHANIETQLGNGELQVFFQPKHYANINWKFFLRDWSNYDELVIKLHNPNPASVSLTCRIHDKAHESNYRYDDRFSQNYTVPSGDYALLIDLDKVANAPASRRMDMRVIYSMHCFTRNLKAPTMLVFKQIRLQ